MPKPKQNQTFQMLLFAAFAAAGILILYFASAAIKTPNLPLTTLEGELELLHGDDFENKKSIETHYLITDSGIRYKLDFGDKKGPLHLTGSKIKIKGVQAGNIIKLKTSDFQVTQAAEVKSSPRKVAIVAFNADYNSAVSVDKALIKQNIYAGSASVDNFYREASFGKRSIIGKNSEDGDNDIFGPYTISFQRTNDCRNDYGPMANKAHQAAVAAGVDLTGYDHIIYAGVNTSCGLIAGWGSIGGGFVYLYGIFGLQENIGTPAHELGHNFGLHHANSISCKDPNGNRVSLSSNCLSFEYDDSFSVMGGQGHLSNYEKGRLLWLQPANTQNVSASGTYSIKPIEVADAGVQSLRIPIGSFSVPSNQYTGGGWSSANAYYYLEFRRPIGFDSFLTSTLHNNVADGVLVRISTDYPQMVLPVLIDMTPETSNGDVNHPSIGTWKNGTFDASLKPGKCFTDTAKKITIETLNVSNDEAKVKVTLNSTGGCLAPQNMRLKSKTDQAVGLEWDRSTDSNVAGYNVFRSDSATGALVKIGSSATNSYIDTAVVPTKNYWYAVSAFDKNTPAIESGQTARLFVDRIGPTFAVGHPKADNLYIATPEANLPNPCPTFAPSSNNGRPLFRRAGLAQVTNPSFDDSGISKVEAYFDGTLIATFTSIPSAQHCFGVPSAIRNSVPMTFIAYDTACITSCNRTTKTILVDTLP